MPRQHAQYRVELWITPTGDCDGYNIVGRDPETWELVALTSTALNPPLDSHTALEHASNRLKASYGFQLSLFPSY